jgi:hypothetical protein
MKRSGGFRSANALTAYDSKKIVLSEFSVENFLTILNND